MAQTRTIQPLDTLPLTSRMMNAFMSYVMYLAKTIWPQDLSVFYPLPGQPPALWPGLAALAGVCFLSLAALSQLRRRPHLSVGWFWYVGTLIPVIGIVQVGLQAMADRYTYIPLVGVFLVVVWGGFDLFERLSSKGLVPVLAASAVLVYFAVNTGFQLGHWKNTGTLFRHAIQLNPENYAAHFILARELGYQGKALEAMGHYDKAVALNPGFVAMMHNRLGYHLAERGNLDGAIVQFKGALDLTPAYANAHNNLGVALARKGYLNDAIVHFSKALEINPK